MSFAYEIYDKICKAFYGTNLVTPVTGYFISYNLRVKTLFDINVVCS